MRTLVLINGLLLAGCAQEAAVEPWIGEQELLEVQSASPRGAQLLEQGERARLGGRHEEAVGLYRLAAEELKTRDQARRFECLLQIERGRQAEALIACEQAANVRNTPATRRAMAGALMAGTARATIAELARAKGIADTLIDQSTQSPYGFAAMCDIASKLGDERMLSHYLERLKSVAPAHPETLRQQRLLAGRGPGWTFFAGWALIAALVLGTALHALSRALRRWTPRALASAAGALVLLLAARPAGAQPYVEAEAPVREEGLSYGLSEWGIDLEDPENSVPPLDRLNGNPLQAGYFLMDLTERGEEAERAGRHLSAVKFYRAIAKMVPERATAYSRMCAALQAAGEVGPALDACAVALTKQGVRVEDYVRLSQLIFAGSEPLAAHELEDLAAVVTHLRAQGLEATVAAEKIECEVGFRTDDVKRLQACTAALQRLAPGDPQTPSYQWALALLRKDFAAARQAAARAKELGVASKVVQKMEEVTEASIPLWRRFGTFPPLLLGVVTLGALGLVVRKRRTQP